MRCNIEPFLDEAAEELSWRCTIHRHYTPCPHDGQPPRPGPPVHIDQRPTPQRALAYARRHTGNARPIVMHSDFAAPRLHDTGAALTCWCGPLVSPPAPPVSPARLRTERLWLRLTQAELATAAALTEDDTAAFEDGTTAPTLEQAARLVKALRLDSAARLHDAPPPPAPDIEATLSPHIPPGDLAQIRRFVEYLRHAADAS
jgi:hypothetical protein